MKQKLLKLEERLRCWSRSGGFRLRHSPLLDLDLAFSREVGTKHGLEKFKWSYGSLGNQHWCVFFRGLRNPSVGFVEVHSPADSVTQANEKFDVYGASTHLQQLRLRKSL